MVRLDIRHEVTADEIEEMLRLVDEVETFSGHPALPDQSRLALQQGDSDCLAVVIVRDEHGLAGFAQVSPTNDSWTLDLVLTPDEIRRRAVPVDDLVTTSLDALVDGGHTPTDVRWWRSDHRHHDHDHDAVDHDHDAVDDVSGGERGTGDPAGERRADSDDLYVRLGFRLERELLQMRRPLPTGQAVTIETRPFVPGQDEQAFLDVNNRAFAGHPEQGGWTPSALQAREGEAWFDPNGFRLHEHDGRLAGFCWTKVHPPSPTERHHHETEGLGEIYVIAVDPDLVGRGLGAQLTLAGLEHLASLGISEAMLYVDADNHAAVALYERLGFSTHSTSRAYVRHVDPSAEAVAAPLTRAATTGRSTR